MVRPEKKPAAGGISMTSAAAVKSTSPAAR
jgi:hypothetical protein